MCIKLHIHILDFSSPVRNIEACFGSWQRKTTMCHFLMALFKLLIIYLATWDETFIFWGKEAAFFVPTIGEIILQYQPPHYAFHVPVLEGGNPSKDNHCPHIHLEGINLLCVDKMKSFSSFNPLSSDLCHLLIAATQPS